jgi:predicted ATPase/class 3 adenylate cyclase
MATTGPQSSDEAVPGGALPTGTVTFVMTDVEGSTPLWEREPDAAHLAMARHDVLVTEAVQRHRGVPIRPRGEGDSRFAVFSSAADGVAGALAIQQALVAEHWPTSIPVKVRIGVHTGEVRLRDADYYGTEVNRCARLRGLGHGGQILVSDVTAELVRETLPPGASLDDLGEHWLKGLSRPLRVYQLVAPGLPTDLPPLDSPSAHRHNLPVQRTSLLGRAPEIELGRRLLHASGARIVTVTGPGGVGKTRLALHLAESLLPGFADGVWLVDLASIVEPALVPFAIARALGLQEQGGRPLAESVVEYLRPLSLLLLLDNFEHVLGAAPFVATLLAACPNVRVLVTSREPLHLYGEHELPVPPLALPRPDDRADASALSEHAATALFVQRARAVKPDLVLTAATAASISRSCIQLDGLPLAIELAAARVKQLSPPAILERLERAGGRASLSLLVAGPRDAPSRQQTLRNTIAWSYALLTDDDRMLFRRLAIFVGGFSLAAVRDVVADPRLSDDDWELDLLDLLGSLADKSLLRRTDDVAGEPRWRLLETIRRFGLERLREEDDVALVQRRHVEHYVALAEAAEGKLRGQEQAAWLDRLEAEHANMRAAMAWSVGESRDPECASRLASALALFWFMHGHLSEGSRWLDQALAADASVPPVIRAKARVEAGALARFQSRPRRAAELLEAGVGLYRELGNLRGVARGLSQWGFALQQVNSADERAPALLEESAEIYRLLGDRAGLALALFNIGAAAVRRHNLDLAQQGLDEALALYRALGDNSLVARVLGHLGKVACARGAYDQATRLCDEAVALSRHTGNYPAMTYALSVLGDVAHALGQDDRATELYIESLEGRRARGHLTGLPECLQGLACAAAARHAPDWAPRLLGAAEAMIESAGTGMSLAGLDRLARDVAALKERQEVAAFDAAWTAGRAMTIDQAFELALEPATPTPTPAIPTPLAPS